ncbi:MAG: RHS repeat-associated core domain-containing protein [Akkermansiaceae bacterium]|nr:RHS repeat-associated core domain-containing protein [Akkermansiaceae bacterium]
MIWACSVGALRGLGAELSEQLQIVSDTLSRELAAPGALRFSHPAAAVLEIPRGGRAACPPSLFFGLTACPLAIRKDGTWYCYGWDLTKNVCEVFGPAGYIRTVYSYAPCGEATASGDVSQPFRRSSEFDDEELGLVYYNYRHYNPTDGRWLSRDLIEENGGWNLYAFLGNSPLLSSDRNGLFLLVYLLL